MELTKDKTVYRVQFDKIKDIQLPLLMDINTGLNLIYSNDIIEYSPLNLKFVRENNISYISGTVSIKDNSENKKDFSARIKLDDKKLFSVLYSAVKDNNPIYKYKYLKDRIVLLSENINNKISSESNGVFISNKDYNNYIAFIIKNRTEIIGISLSQKLIEDNGKVSYHINDIFGPYLSKIGTGKDSMLSLVIMNNSGIPIVSCNVQVEKIVKSTSTMIKHNNKTIEDSLIKKCQKIVSKYKGRYYDYFFDNM